MMALLTRLLAGPLVDAVVSILRSMEQREISRAQVRAEVRKAVLAALKDMENDLVAARRDVLLADLRGQSRLQRLWRPVVALTAFFTYWYVIAVIPHLVSWGWMTPPRFGERGLENLFWLTTVCVGGYITGRTAEKIASLLHNR